MQIQKINWTSLSLFRLFISTKPNHVDKKSELRKLQTN